MVRGAQNFERGGGVKKNIRANFGQAGTKIRYNRKDRYLKYNKGPSQEDELT